MKISQRLKYIISVLLCLAGISFVLLYQPSLITGVVGLIAMILFFIFGGIGLSEIKFFSRYDWAPFWNSIILFFIFLLIQTAVYFASGISSLSLMVTFVLIALGLIIRVKKVRKLKLYNIISIDDLFYLPILGLQVLLFYKLFEKTTTIALGSPWLLVGPRFFVIFGVINFLLLLYLYRGKHSGIKYVALFTQFLLTLGVAGIIYKLGFGYDPFLHRAAEKEILANGAIFPKTPFYIGQYALVTLLAKVSHSPLFYIDAWLVPVATSLLLPLTVFYTMTKGFLLKKKSAFVATLLLPLYPLSVFFVTTPHNFATMLTLVTFLLGTVCLKEKKFLVIPSLISVFAFAVHPLSGMFAVLYMIGIGSYLNKNKFSKNAFIFGKIFYIFGGLFAMPILFFSYLFLKGVSLPSPVIIFERLSVFASLFSRPYYFVNRPEASIVIDWVYAYQVALPVVLFLFAIYGLLKFGKGKWFPLLFSFFLLSNVFFLSTWVVISDLNSFEQIQYAERLRHILLYPLLGFSLFGLIKQIEKLNKKNVFLFSCFLVFSVSLTTSFYLTYPQQNTKVHFPGYNVSSSDIKAAKFIEENSKRKSHVVLSHMLTAAASIDQFGFSRYVDTKKGNLFYYAVPSGSPLAEEFRNMVYVNQDRSHIDEVFKLTDAEYVYFAVSDYWSKSNSIIAEASKTANEVYVIDNGAITIFRYER